MSDKAIDNATGISIRFVQKFDITPDANPQVMCMCGYTGSHAGFIAHVPACPFAQQVPHDAVHIAETP